MGKNEIDCVLIFDLILSPHNGTLVRTDQFVTDLMRSRDVRTAPYIDDHRTRSAIGTICSIIIIYSD